PKRTDEFWRFSNTAGIKLDGYEVGRVIPGLRSFSEGGPNAPAFSVPNFAHSATLAFANNRPASAPALPADLAARGVIFTSLEDALVKHADLVRRYFQAQAANLGADKLAALTAALTTSGAFLYVPHGVEILTPFIATHVATGAGSAVFPHTIVIAEDHAKVTLVEFFLSTDE